MRGPYPEQRSLYLKPLVNTPSNPQHNKHGHGSQGNPNNKEQFEASAMDTVFKAHKRAEGTALHRMEMQCDASVLA
ncbi:ROTUNDIFOLIA like 7 [Prunus dulcis]|uniref:ROTUNDIFOLIA like 7 n=1 Tax=Prunus dulcis TaxID=3755 RepID=A0A4Y1S2E7_PRUDU|nr:ROTUNDIFOLIA like 7 [Prunus dulcis]